MLRVVSVVMLLASAMPATAQSTAVSAPQATPKAQVDPLDKIVCRVEEGLGSRLNRKKVCMSLRDWKEQADDARGATEKLQQLTQNPKSG